MMAVNGLNEHATRGCLHFPTIHVLCYYAEVFISFLIIYIIFSVYVMEQKLKEFKSRRRREILISKPKEFFRGIIEKISPKKITPVDSCEVQCSLLNNKSLSDSSGVREDETSTLSVASDDVSISLMPKSWLDVITNFLYFLLWVIIYLIAIHFEFGFVYLVLSGLIFIYYNTRTGPKKKGEISAYSVFNPGCEAIEGTLKAEQLEREFNLIQH